VKRICVGIWNLIFEWEAVASWDAQRAKEQLGTRTRTCPILGCSAGAHVELCLHAQVRCCSVHLPLGLTELSIEKVALALQIHE